jgi:hypothetical protein
LVLLWETRTARLARIISGIEGEQQTHNTWQVILQRLS